MRSYRKWYRAHAWPEVTSPEVTWLFPRTFFPVFFSSTFFTVLFFSVLFPVLFSPYSTHFYSIFSISFHHSTYFSSIFSLSFHNSTYFFFCIFQIFTLLNLLFFISSSPTYTTHLMIFPHNEVLKFSCDLNLFQRIPIALKIYCVPQLFEEYWAMFSSYQKQALTVMISP